MKTPIPPLPSRKLFEGYTNRTTNDQCSASKSIASAITGIAINDKLRKSDAEFLYNYIKKAYQYTKVLNGNPYFEGGMYITSRDMVKFGQLYVSKGKWNRKRIVSKKMG